MQSQIWPPVTSCAVIGHSNSSVWVCLVPSDNRCKHAQRLCWLLTEEVQRWSEDTAKAVWSQGRGRLMYDVICRRLSACVLYWTVLEAVAGPWQRGGELWFGRPHRCLTDTTGVNISHRDFGGGLWWRGIEREGEREEREERARERERHVLAHISKKCEHCCEILFGFR